LPPGPGPHDLHPIGKEVYKSVADDEAKDDMTKVTIPIIIEEVTMEVSKKAKLNPTAMASTLVVIASTRSTEAFSRFRVASPDSD